VKRSLKRLIERERWLSSVSEWRRWGNDWGDGKRMVLLDRGFLYEPTGANDIIWSEGV